MIYICEKWFKEKLIEIKANKSKAPLFPPKPEGNISFPGLREKGLCPYWWVEQWLPFLLQSKLAINQTLI